MRGTTRTRTLFALAAPMTMAGLFFGLVVLPAVFAAQLSSMSAWDSQDWQIDMGTLLGFPAIEGWTPPSRVYFQSVHEPVQEYYAQTAESQAFSQHAYCYTQVSHTVTMNNYQTAIAFYSPDASPNLFCEYNEYKLAKLNYWAYQAGTGAWWSGEIQSPETLEVMAFNADPAFGQIKVYVQTEYARADIAAGGRIQTFAP